MSEATPRERNTAMDMLRGLVMVLMTLDHARDFFADGNRIKPTDLATTTPILFFTRWVTHFCAPVFVFLAGTAAFLYGARRDPAATSRFLFTRGLWLVFLELTVMRLGWTPEPFYRFTLLQVIWALGWSMILLSVICRFSIVVTAVFGAAIIAGHNLLDFIHRADLGSLGWLWSILHERSVLEPSPGHLFFVAYPLVPWCGVMAAGYAFGSWMQLPQETRRRRTLRLGLALSAAFVVLRALNQYGDPVPWSAQRSALFTVLAFLNCEKYPPSLLFLLMTLGPALCLLSWFESIPPNKIARALAVIGSVPLIYYVAHLILLRWSALPISYVRFGMSAFQPPPNGHAGSAGFGLFSAYIAWGAAVMLLLPLCRWFASVKQRRRDWWMSYL